MDALAGLSFEPVHGDVLDKTALTAAMKGVGWVFHVAAVSDYWRQQGTAWLYRVNVGGTRKVLEAALRAGVRRVVFTSSAAALGVSSNNSSRSGTAGPESRLLNEAATFNLIPALSPYGHSKHLAEQVVGEFVARGLEVVIVNPTVVLGPRDLNRISGSLILAVYGRKVPVIPPGGVNYVDVADVVAGHIAAAERGKNGARYILAAHNLTHDQAVRVIARVVGVPPPRLRVPGGLLPLLAVAMDLFNRVWPGEPLADGNQVRLMKHTLFYNGSRAQRELGLGPPISFPDSVERTFRWYREHGYL